MIRFGYKQCRADHTMFVERENDIITILTVYVDDIVMTDNNEEEMTSL